MGLGYIGLRVTWATLGILGAFKMFLFSVLTACPSHSCMDVCSDIPSFTLSQDMYSSLTTRCIGCRVETKVLSPLVLLKYQITHSSTESKSGVGGRRNDVFLRSFFHVTNVLILFQV